MNISDYILEEYDENLDLYKELEETVFGILCDNIDKSSLIPMQISHRIKARNSVLEKIFRKPDKYSNIKEMTDIVGFRVICFFSNQVDEIAKIIENIFEVDSENSIDKRVILEPNVFGYLSLHYICRMPDNYDCDDVFKSIPFEIQIRSVLQHTWAEIEHDLGYKTSFGIPRSIRREFSRIAGLLEVADEAFVNIKKHVLEYEEEVRESIHNDSADEMSVDLITVTEFMKRSSANRELIEKIASITGATIKDISCESCLPMFDFFNINTLGDIEKLISKRGEEAYFLAKDLLKGNDMEELISTVGFYFLFRAELIYGDYSRKDIENFYAITHGDNKKKIKNRTDSVLKKREKVLGM